MDKLLQTFLTTAAPSGYEDALQAKFTEAITGFVDCVETDVLGNVIATK